MELSEKNKQYIILLDDIFNITSLLNTKAYIWGGLTIDIWEGRFLREHGDLDGFILNLIENLGDLTEQFQRLGYETNFSKEFLIFTVKKGGIHGSFNPLKIDDKTAQWKHIGNDGTVFFPVSWLDETPAEFYHTKVHTAGIKFEYAVKTKVSMLHPEWQLREHDKSAIAYMKEQLLLRDINEEDIYKWFWSYNPYWYKRGYDEFFKPTTAWTIQAK